MKTVQRIIGILSTIAILVCLSTVCFAAIHMHDWHYVWDNGLYAVCDMCNTRVSVTLNTDGVYSYCPESIIDPNAWVEENGWQNDKLTGATGYSDTGKLKAYHFVYADLDGDNWWEGTPSEPGDYKVAVCLDLYTEVEDVSGDYENFETYATVHLGHTVSDEWTADGSKLCNCCTVCGAHLAEISMEDSIGNACSERKHVPKINTWYLDESLEEKINDVYPQVILLFEGKGETEYPLSKQIPGEKGTYNVCFAMMDDFEDINTVTLRTEPVNYEVKAHVWEYTADEYAIHADCMVCDAHAEVCIDTSTVYEASRTYNGRTLDYEVFYEKDWSRQEDIEPYTVLFSGLETISETSTTMYDHAFVKPKTTGSYTVRLAMLENPDDPDTAWLSSKEKPYYLADISIGECEILTYGPTQIAQFTEPALSGGYYQVGTLSELLWCLSKKNQNANISLTNDIVVNPITVNEEGEIRSAGYQIYKWSGFGTEKNAFTGNIIGNGYTIYGLYQPDSSVHFNGFVNNGKNCKITGLTVENSVLYGTDAAAIVGHYDHTSSNEDKVSDCHSLNCYFQASSTCAGIISWLTTAQTGSMAVTNCGNNSIISGDAEKGAGGIIGRAEGVDILNVQSCYNLGPVESRKGKAGGIIGQTELGTAKAYITIWDCFNTGSVSCPNYIGGIVGYIADYNGNKGIYIDNCTSTGYLYASKNLGGIAGYISTGCMDNKRSTVLGNFYYNAKIGFRTADSKVDLEEHATKLTRTEVNGNFICSKYEHTPCSHWTAVSSANCTRDGELTLKCAVCNATMESETIRAYGHCFEYGECIYCGANEDDEEGLFGTIFGNPPMVIVIVVVNVLLILMFGWLIFNRKKCNQTEK